MFAVIPLILSILACSIGLPLPALAPSTATPTAADTSTPQPTYTPSEVPLPLTISGCLFVDSCPTAHSIREYFPPDTALYDNSLHAVTVSTNDEVRFLYGWCALDRTYLEEDKAQMVYVFEIDGISYLDKIDQGYTSQPYENDPTLTYPCYSIGGVLSGWKIGENHTVVIGATFLSEINDGWDTYSAGDHLAGYTINVSNIPTRAPATATPEVVATATRKPTNTAVPQVYNTEVPACSATGSISVTNNTDGWLSISFNGPGSFNYGLGSGETQSFAVCPGTYDYSAFGCGGAADYGTASDGDSLTFSCVTP